VQLLNATALPLQLGCAAAGNAISAGGEPLLLEVLAPGEAVWLPLQVKHATV
jgi:hypothetical protein